MKFNEGIFDSHVHPSNANDPDAFLQSAIDHLSASGLDGENLLFMRMGAFNSVGDAMGLYLKTKYPSKFTIYGGISIMTPGFRDDGPGLREQLQATIDAGFDGVKMGAKNFDLVIRGYGVDDARFDDMFDLLEETGFPCIYHISDPEFWPAKRGPGVDQRRFMDIEERAVTGDTYETYLPRIMHYYNEGSTQLDSKKPVQLEPFDLFNTGPGIPSQREPLTHEEKEIMFSQVENMMNRHPKAKITFPHALFMSGDLERLAGFLDRHPSVSIDITPGYEQFYNYSRRLGDWREFFVKYQDRIIFGTDNNFMSSPAREIAIVRNFFETDEKFFVPTAHNSWGIDIHGIAPVPHEVLRKIYRDNFFGQCNPKKVVPEKAAAYSQYIYDCVRDQPSVSQETKDGLKELIRRFKEMR